MPRFVPVSNVPTSRDFCEVIPKELDTLRKAWCKFCTNFGGLCAIQAVLDSTAPLICLNLEIGRVALLYFRLRWFFPRILRLLQQAILL
jgi:hypothetical protein